MESLEYRRLKFKDKIHEASGNTFQQLFYKIMKATTEGNLFQEICPSGSDGDKGCDGYILNKGIFYQVYGPADPTKRDTIKNAESKLVKDFKTLHKNVTKHGYYEEIKEYYFVYNDKFSTNVITPNFDKKLSALRSDYKGIVFSYITSDDLMRLFLSTDEITQKTIIDTFFGIDLNNPVKYEFIDDIVNHLAKSVEKYNFEDTYYVPDFDEKIAFNGLSEKLGTSLKESGSYAADVESALESYNETFKDDLKNLYIKLYHDAREQYPEKPDKQFTLILNQSIPEHIKIKNDPVTENSYKTNVMLLMAKYFESCDIFEAPTT